MRLRDDLTVIILGHSEQNEFGKTIFKSTGKMLEKQITVAGMFTISLETVVENGQYYFLTKNNGNNTAKAPMGMFDKELIPNDLKLVTEAINNY